LRQILASTASDQKITVVVRFRDQLDLAALRSDPIWRAAPRKERRGQAVLALRSLAQADQRKILPIIDRLRHSGQAESYRSFSVVNAFAIRATASAIRQLARIHEIESITEETRTSQPVLAATLSPPSDAEPCWAISAIGADRLWARGIDGRGVIVGMIDAGASVAHEQLHDNYRGGDRSFYDPQVPSASPHESSLVGHGTGLLSVAVGMHRREDNCGIAPAAQWVAAIGLPEGHYSNVAVLEAADWMLNTAQPDIILNAWIVGKEGCDRSLGRVIDAWRTAEMLPVFAAGNFGESPGSDRSPANLSTLSVGATTRDGHALPKSSRGPNSCDGGIYPVVSAPGHDLMSALPLRSDLYIRAEGTSYAAAVVAGAAALLLQVDPEASVDDLEKALRESATDLGQSGPDNTFGYGQVDVARAAELLRHR
jgi:bacillopeptidase F